MSLKCNSTLPDIGATKSITQNEFKVFKKLIGSGSNYRHYANGIGVYSNGVAYTDGLMCIYKGEVLWGNVIQLGDLKIPVDASQDIPTFEAEPIGKMPAFNKMSNECTEKIMTLDVNNLERVFTALKKLKVKKVDLYIKPGEIGAHPFRLVDYITQYEALVTIIR